MCGYRHAHHDVLDITSPFLYNYALSATDVAEKVA